MQIDVIIPTFNRASTVSSAIDSVLNQTYKNFNIIIVDDGSTDDTLNVLEKYKHIPIVHILSQTNKGVSSARNLAVKHSKAPWIAFLDSDDEWLVQKLETQVLFLKKHSNFRFLHCEEIWVRNKVRVNPKVKHQKSEDNIFMRSLDFCLISPSTVIMQRDLFNECGAFDENFVVCEDYDLWLKILSREEIGFLNEHVTIKNGGHADQLSTQYVAMDFWRIKSLVNLYHQRDFPLNDEKKEQVKNVIAKKSEILLRGYQKHQNSKAFNEVTEMISTIIDL